MKATNQNTSIFLQMDNDEALVLLEWLHNFNEGDHQKSFQDQAEEQLLFDLEAELENILTDPFEKDYIAILSRARQKIRNKE